jgi:phenylpropionate dioxygenase-like ring-hydroxylating dioxygenase large terminal subunit
MRQLSGAEHPHTMPLRIPYGWYLAGPLAELAAKPRSVRIGAAEYVSFLTASKIPVVLDGRCVHMGAQEFDREGTCRLIPASPGVPAFARQRAYPTATYNGLLFFFNAATPAFPLPMYDGKPDGNLRRSRPFHFDVRLPWYMVAANGFDLQHFRTAHDRTLVNEPIVTTTNPFCRQVEARFRVSGNGFRDRLTRSFSGEDVVMTIRSWCGVLILVTATFRRTTSYGMVCVEPVSANRTRLTTFVSIDKRTNWLGRRLVDPLDVAIRRSFIRAFMKDDIDRCDGIGYTKDTLIEEDSVLRNYFEWVRSLDSVVQ